MGKVPTYKVKAKVLIDIETDFEAYSQDEIPTPETLKFCVDEDIGDRRDIAGAINDCKVVDFHTWEDDGE